MLTFAFWPPSLPALDAHTGMRETSCIVCSFTVSAGLHLSAAHLSAALTVKSGQPAALRAGRRQSAAAASGDSGGGGLRRTGTGPACAASTRPARGCGRRCWSGWWGWTACCRAPPGRGAPACGGCPPAGRSWPSCASASPRTPRAGMAEANLAAKQSWSRRS